MSVPLNDIIKNEFFCQCASSIKRYGITPRDFSREQGSRYAWFEGIPDAFKDVFSVYIKLEPDGDNFTLAITEEILNTKKYVKTGTNPLTLILDFAAIVNKASSEYNHSDVDEEWAKWGF